MKGVSDNDYRNAQKLWNTTEKKTLDYYHNTYLKIDALILAGVLETFQNI